MYVVRPLDFQSFMESRDYRYIALKTRSLWVTLTSIPGLHMTQLWFIGFFVGRLLFYYYYFFSFTYPKFFPTLYFFKDSYDQDISSLEHSGGIILFTYFIIFRSVHLYCSQDPTTNSELVLKFRIPQCKVYTPSWFKTTRI